MTEANWSPAQRRAWRWPDIVLPSAWAQENRQLPPSMTAEPGPWRNERTPYMVGIMDAVADPNVETIVVLKAAQIGFSEAIRNILGYWIDHEPGPTLLVMPNQKSAEELIEERVRPLIEATPAVNRHITSRAWDVQKQRIKLDTMSLYVGWAGSSQSLKSRPIRYLIFDEPDEYPAVSGVGGDPISKGMKRVTTYSAKRRARIIIGGTPTNRYGNICRQWESCGERREYWVPCPHCGRWQRLIWGGLKDTAGVKWPKIDEGDRMKRADMILSGQLAWYKCEACDDKILDLHKTGMIQRGTWANDDQVVKPDGRIVGPAGIKARKIGFHLSALYSPWVSFSQLASEFVAAKDDYQSLIDFTNQRLAQPFEEQRAKTLPKIFGIKAKDAPDAEIVPEWARLLIASADTQGADAATGYFYWTVRAWSYEYRSQLVDCGVVQSFSELRRATLDREYPLAGDSTNVSPQILVIDSGGPRWSEVYEFALTDATRVKPTKGANRQMRWMLDQRLQKKHGVVLWEIDTDQSKDLLHRLIHDDDPDRWQVNKAIDNDYAMQMSAEHKIFDPHRKREIWIAQRRANHYWDCEHQQCAAAWFLGAGAAKPEGEGESETRPQESRPRAGSNWVTGYRGKW